MATIAERLQAAGVDVAKMDSLRDSLPKHVKLDKRTVLAENMFRLLDMCARDLRLLPPKIREQTKKTVGLATQIVRDKDNGLTSE